MRILYLTNSAQIGGGNRQLQVLWEGLRNYGIEPLVVCPAAGPMVELCRDIGVSVEVLQYPQPSWRSPIATIQGYRTWQQLLKRIRPDLIHANDFINARSVSLSARHLALPLVCHVHFPMLPDALRWMFRGLPKPWVFIYNSQATRRVCEPIIAQICRGSQHLVIYNCVSTERFFPDENNGTVQRIPRVGIVANLIPIKGHMDFLEMARLVTDRHVTAEYWIIGEDIQKSGFGVQLKTRCVELGLKERVKFLGYQSEVPDLLRQLDVVVCASHAEPFGLCLIEAMSCELPVVGTRCDGIPEVIEADVTGYLVAPQAPKELADKVELLLSDPSLRKRMGKAGRHRVKVLFSRDEHVKRMIEVYKNLTCVGGLA